MKTVIDAVNALKGNVPDSLLGFHKWTFYLTSDMDCTGLSFNGVFVCTFDQFNKCVEEMTSMNIKPVYTQAMADNGELPRVGADCLVKGSIDDDYHHCEILMHRRIDNHLDVAMFVIKDYDDRPFYYSHCSADYFKPLTPPIELIDGNAYQFINIEDNTIHGIYSEDEHSFTSLNIEWSAQTCTNIQLLEVKS